MVNPTCMASRVWVPEIQKVRVSSLLHLAAIERKYQSTRHRVLILHRVTTFQEGRLIRHVTAKFEPADDMVRHHALERGGELVEVNSSRRVPGREAVMIVVIFVTGAESRGAADGVLYIAGDSGPEDGLREHTLALLDPVTPPIVAVDHERQLAGGRVSDHSVAQLTPGRVDAVLLRTRHVVLDDTELLVWGPAKTHAVGFPGIVVHHIVPAVHKISGERVLIVEGVLCPHPKAVVRDGVGEQQASGIIPVVLGLDNLGSVRRDELTDIHLQSLAYGS